MHTLERAALPFPAEDHDVEPAAPWHWRNIVGANVGERGKAVSDDPAVADASDHSLYFGMVDAQHGQAVERHVLDELDERVLDPLEAAVMFEMLGIDVGHH